jgi:hypothetical protein
MGKKGNGQPTFIDILRINLSFRLIPFLWLLNIGFQYSYVINPCISQGLVNSFGTNNSKYVLKRLNRVEVSIYFIKDFMELSIPGIDLFGLIAVFLFPNSGQKGTNACFF